MEYRRFGRTNLSMPVISCGGMRYQQAWKDVEWSEIGDESQANLEATIRASLACGINHIETARGYGSSERQLGRILPTLPRDELIVQTKVGVADDGEGFLNGFNTSMSRLGLDHLDLLGVHGVNTRELLDKTLRPGGSLEMALQLKEQGRTRFVGFSTHAPLDVIVDAINTGQFDYVNLHWYWADQLNAPAIEAAKAHDMGVFIISPNDKGGKLYSPPEKLCELTAPLTPMAFNDLFCWRNPDVHTLSCGAARPTDFDAHLAALEYYGQWDEVLPPIEARLRAAAEEVFDTAWLDHWHEGLPDTDAVPGTVNLYHVLRLYTLAKAYDLTEFARMRYNLFGNGGHWFYGNKVDKLEWPALPAVIAGSPVADRIPDVLREAHEMLDAEAQKRLSQS